MKFLFIILQIVITPQVQVPTYKPPQGVYPICAQEVNDRPPIYKAPHNTGNNEYWAQWPYWEDNTLLNIDSLFYDGSGPLNGGWWPNTTEYWPNSAQTWIDINGNTLNLPPNWDFMTNDEKWNWLWDATHSGNGENHGEDRPWSNQLLLNDELPLLLTFILVYLGFSIYLVIKSKNGDK